MNVTMCRKYRGVEVVATPQLTRREEHVLRFVVEDFLRSGDPVSSSRVARRSAVGLSSASIRNVMAALEEKGLLCRAHHSAGREPTDAGLRGYVDRWVHAQPMTSGSMCAIRQRVLEVQRDFVEDLIWISELLADLTAEAGLAVRPLGTQPTLEAVSLARVEAHRVLGVVVTSDGRVRRRLCELGVVRTSEQLQRVENFLNLEYRGWTLDRIAAHLRNRALDENRFDGERQVVRSLASHLCSELLAPRDGEPADMVVSGTRRLLDFPEFSDSDRMRALVGVLNDAGRLVAVLGEKLVDHEPCVLIGRESELTSAGDLAMVASVFHRSGRRAGAVAVVGPRRMQYARVVPVVRLIGDTLTSLWSEGEVVHAG